MHELHADRLDCVDAFLDAPSLVQTFGTGRDGLCVEKFELALQACGQRLVLGITQGLIVLNQLYEKISPTCCVVTVFGRDGLVSSGTGFAYSGNGMVLTAGHVVSGRFPIRTRDYKDPNQQIYCKFPGLPVAEYQVAFCGITIEVALFSEPVQIDFAMLMPKASLTRLPSQLLAKVHPPRLGDRVFLAGYSDELRLPFEFGRLLHPSIKGVPEYLEAMNKGYMADMTGPLIKQGHVGNVRRIVSEISQSGDRIECDYLYVDNSMHCGASGGPIVDESGEAVGIIIKRAVTSASQANDPSLEVPSGCTIGIGLQPLMYIARMTGSAQQ